MVDVISGPSRAPRRPRVWLVVLVVIGLGAAAVGYVASRARHSRQGVAPSVTATSSPAGVDEGFAGPPLEARTGLRLLLDGAGLRIVDVDRGATAPVLPFAQLNAKLQFVPVRGGAAFPVSPCGGAECLGVYFVPAGQTDAVLLSKGTNVAASADGTDLWVTATDAGGQRYVREIAVDGRFLSPAYPIPADRSVLRGTAAGLLTIVRDPSGASAGELWDPVSGHIDSRFAVPIAVASDTVAWLGPGCARVSCPLRLTELSSGRTWMVPVPTGAVIDRGAFSPDGARLAVRIGASGGTGPVTLGIVDVTAGQLVSVAGTTVSSGGLAFAWSRDGAWLALLAYGLRAGSPMAVWHAGDQVVHPIPGPHDAWSLAPA